MKNLTILIIHLFIFNLLLAAQQDFLKVDKIDRIQLQKIIKERNDKPLFINLWATWCVPCREEFPTINTLVNEYKNIEFIGISIDYPDEVETKIIPFLRSQKAKFKSYVNAFERDEDLINFLDKEWNGALPATFIFDKSGNKVLFLEGKRSYKEFKKAIEKAIK